MLQTGFFCLTTQAVLEFSRDQAGLELPLTFAGINVGGKRGKAYMQQKAFS